MLLFITTATGYSDEDQHIYFVLRQIAEMLHEKGIDPLVQDNYGATALIYACANQVTALGEFILSKT